MALTINHINSTTCVAQAYVAQESGDTGRAIRLMRDAASWAYLAGDHSRQAACARAIVTLRASIGHCHLSVIEGY